MLDEKQAKLAMDVKIGEEHRHVLENYIRPFIDEMSTRLFHAFGATPVGDVEALKDIKLQLTAIASLESYFTQYVESGQLAKFELERDK